MTTGRPDCWRKGNAAACAGAAGSFYERGNETTGRREQRVAAAELLGLQDLSNDYGPTEQAADAADDSAGAAVPARDYGPDGSAGWLCRSAPRQADDTTTRPSGSGPTSQSDARDIGPSFYTPIDRARAG